MFSGGEVPANANAVLRSGALIPHFVATCGEFDPRAYEQSLLGFGDLLDLPRYAQLTNGNMSPGQVSELYRRFLAEGGNCSPTPFANHTRLRINQILGTSEATARYTLWESYSSEYFSLAAALMAYADTSTANGQRSILRDARRLEIMAQNAGSIEDTHPNIFYHSGQNILDHDFLIYAYQLHLKDFNAAISNFIKRVTSLDSEDNEELFFNSKDTVIANAFRQIQTEWEELNNPFNFINTIKSALEMNGGNVEISIGHPEKYEALRPGAGNATTTLNPANPIAVRILIGKLILAVSRMGTPEQPVKVNFSWDEENSELEMTIKDRWTPESSSMNAIAAAMNEYTTPLSWRHALSSFSGDYTFYVRVPIIDEPSESGNSGGSNSAPSGGISGFYESSGSANGIAAVPASAEISGFYVPKSQRPIMTLPAYDKDVAGTHPGIYEYVAAQSGIGMPCILDAVIIGASSPYPLYPMNVRPGTTPFMPYPTFSSVHPLYR